jgi:hypothetical protein
LLGPVTDIASPYTSPPRSALSRNFVLEPEMLCYSVVEANRKLRRDIVPRGTLDIGSYEPPAPTDSESKANTRSAPPTVARNPGRSVSRYGVVGAGALASLLLHALLITALTWGGSHARPQLPQHRLLDGPGSHDEEDGVSMTLVSIEEADPNATVDQERIASPTLESVSLKAALANVSVPNSSEADAAAQTALVGLYLGQINARIDRAWLRPRTPVEQGLFSCRVRIEQDAHGEVKEITLEHCNGDTRWQVSLVHAIQLASPLPAPPDPTVFSKVLRMSFRAEPYSPHAPQDAYEPALIVATKR